MRETPAKPLPPSPARKPRKPPSIATMRRWLDTGIARAVDGCKVEPDGRCPHGSPSWLIVIGGC